MKLQSWNRWTRRDGSAPQTFAARFHRAVRGHAHVFAAGLLVLLLSLSGALTPIDRAVEAIRFQTIEREATGQVVVVAIDSRSLDQVGSWPWSRARFAEAIRTLHGAGAGYVGFDVDFSARANTRDDAELAEAIRASAGWVILPAFLQSDGLYQNQPLGDLAANALVGSVNIELDRDGRIRRYSLGRQHGTSTIPSIGSLLAGVEEGPVSSFGIDFGIRQRSIPVISMADVLTGEFDASVVEGRSILIGATAVELGDQFSTPVSIATSGVLVHALAAESLLQNREIGSVPIGWPVAAALIVLLTLWPRSRLKNVGLVMVVHAVIAGGVVVASFAVQALAPVSISVAAILAAQVLCVWEAVRLELVRRKADLANQRELHLRTIAYEDVQTGLPNRRAMQEHLSELFSAWDGGFATVSAIGVENLGTLRAAIGAAQANEAVIDLARVLEQTYRGGAVFCLSPGVVGLVLSGELAMRADARRPTGTGQLSMRVSAASQSIDLPIRVGMRYLRGPDTDAATVVDGAILALEYAQSRNMMVADQDDIAHIDPSLQLAIFTELIPGLDRGDFTLAYQRKTLADGRIVGAEALIRWNHPQFGPMRPDHFIPISERTGAIAALTRWALSRVIADQVIARAGGVQIPVALNLSGVLLADLDYCRGLATAIRSAEVEISVEITETAEIVQSTAADAAIALLQEAGVKIAIDDYGAGLSSLGYLKRIRAQELKLDKSLVDTITASPRDRLIVQSTVNLAHSLGMKVVAEGVEDDLSRVVLAALGCDLFQGYLFGRPEPIADLVSAIRSQTHAHVVDDAGPEYGTTMRARS